MTRIHRFTGSADTVPVNAYVIEGDDGVVVVDGTLTVSGGRGLRARVEATGKPLAGVLVTHAHPDHYGGLVELPEAPIYALAGVAEAIRRDDDAKEQILRPMLGDEWPARRVFPDRAVAGGDEVTLAGLTFTALDLGPGESPHDGVWLLGDSAFSGDQFYGRMHAYLADGFHEQWLANLARLRRELPPATRLHPGHGEPAGLEMLDWQETYIHTFLDAVRAADWSDPERAGASVVAAMTAFLPADDLRFLMELSIEPVAAQGGLIAG
jgi:glyoxylase-like metal-dependent hydrolase (beta-lactamase superfamily II)